MYLFIAWYSFVYINANRKLFLLVHSILNSKWLYKFATPKNVISISELELLATADT